MTIPGVDTTPTTSLYTSGGSANAGKSLDSESFLNLLIAQLRAQDPSSPMDTNQMMSQTTQLAEMEQLTTMSGLSQESFSLQMRMSAAGLVGNTVSYLDADGNTVSGKATSVSFADSVPTVTIDGTAVKLDAISGITTPTPAATA